MEVRHDRRFPAARFCVVRARPVAERELLAADKPKKSTSTGRPTTRSRCCSRTRACWRRNSPRTASPSAGCRRSAPTRRCEFLNAGSIDFGSTAGSAALVAKINGNPIKSIYVYSRPEWTALVTRKDSTINKIEDLKGKTVAVTRGTDPHIFLVRALLGVGAHREGHHAGAACSSTPTAGPRSFAATSMPGPVSIR